MSPPPGGAPRPVHPAPQDAVQVLGAGDLSPIVRNWSRGLPPLPAWTTNSASRGWPAGSRRQVDRGPGGVNAPGRDRRRPRTPARRSPTPASPQAQSLVLGGAFLQPPPLGLVLAPEGRDPVALRRRQAPGLLNRAETVQLRPNPGDGRPQGGHLGRQADQQPPVFRGRGGLPVVLGRRPRRARGRRGVGDEGQQGVYTDPEVGAASPPRPRGGGCRRGSAVGRTAGAGTRR